MPNLDLVVSHDIDLTMRVRQVSSMFDVPLTERREMRWTASVPFDELESWSVGLIVGPSGSGKTQCARALFGDVDPSFEWSSQSVIDDFSDSLSVEDIATACSAVGFNTIPNWVTPFRMLSNGEQFRVRLARALVESTPDRPLVMDEFTSVVDRQVAKIGSHAVQKYARRNDVQFVAISCHEDVEEWLRPDWVFRPATGEYLAGRWVQRRRPELNVEIRPVRREAWRLFAPFHYLTSSVHMSARFFALFVEGRIASIAAIMNQPSTGKLRIAKVSRLVTLPDWQGLGLAFVLVDALGSAYRARRVLLHTYPAHPSLIRAFDRSMKWTLRSRPGESMTPTSGTGIGGADGPREDTLAQGRPCAVFRYVGAAASSEDVGRLIGPHLFREPK